MRSVICSRRLEAGGGIIVDNGILGRVINLVTGDAEEKIRRGCQRHQGFLDNHKQRGQPARNRLAGLVSGIKKLFARAMEIFMRVEMVQYLGGRRTGHGRCLRRAVTDAGVV